MNDEYILTYFFGKNHNKLNKSLLVNIPNNILEYLNKRYSDSSSILETIERIKKNIDVHPICESCGKPVKYVGSTRMFLNSCGCNECQIKINRIHGNKTNLLKYGVENAAKSNIIKEKTKQTNIKKYGYASPLLNNDIKEKTKQTNIKKYGCEISQSSIIVKHKMSESNKNFWNNINKEEFITNVKEKIKNTCLNKYGVSNPMKLESIYSKVIPKILESRKLNNTLNTSKPEDESYVLIKEKYPDVIRQYKSKEYPFNCDFYIPSINTYIECNYFWTHGFRPYTGTNEDIIQVKEWKEHNTEFYDNAIETWTIKDVKKRNIAKENKLNYIEFWDIDELKIWIADNVQS